jgi:hypothetical protein
MLAVLNGCQVPPVVLDHGYQSCVTIGVAALGGLLEEVLQVLQLAVEHIGVAAGIAVALAWYRRHGFWLPMTGAADKRP